jgi:hypothetical protein
MTRLLCNASDQNRSAADAPLCILQLRLNKVSELIHNSSNYQNLEFARVTVNFQEIIDHVREPHASLNYWEAS